MQTLDVQILDKVADTVSGDIGIDQEMLDDFATHAVRAIINKVWLYNPEMLWAFAVESTISDGNGLAVGSGNFDTVKILGVVRNDGNRDRECVQIPFQLAGRAQDPNDILYATTFEPKVYKQNGTIYVLPTPTSSEQGKVSHPKFPSVDVSAVSSVSSISGMTFPEELDGSVINWVAMQIKLRELAYIRRQSQTEIEKITTAGTGFLADFESALPTFSTIATPSLPTLTLVSMTSLPTLTLSSATDSFPSFNEVIVLPSLSLATTQKTESFTNQTSVTVTHSLGYYPIVQVIDSNGDMIDGEVNHSSVDAFTVVFASAETGTILIGSQTLSSIVEMTSLPSEGMSSITITSPGTLTMPDAINLPTLVTVPLDSLPSDLSYANADFTGISVPSYSAPTPPTIGSLSITNKTITNPGTLTLPSDITLPTLTVTTAPSFTDLDLSGISVPSNSISYTSAGAEPNDVITPGTLPTYVGPSSFSFDTTTISDALTKAEKLIDDGANVGGGDALGSSKSVQGRLSDDDVELSESTINAARQEINRANSAVQNELAQLREFEAETQEALGEFNAEISRYQAELQKEVAAARADVEAYSAKANDNRNDLEAQIAQYRNDIAKYQQQVNATVNEWINEEVQFKLQKWQSQVQSEIAEYNGVVNAVINEYQAESTAKIGEYNANVQRQIQEFRAEMEADVNEWNIQKQRDLDKYSADIQEALGQYQADIQSYAQQIRKVVDTYTAESQSDVSIYQANMRKVIDKFVQQNQVNISEYQAKATAMIANYQADIQNKVQEFTANVNYRISEAQFKLERETQVYQQQVNAFINEYKEKINAAISEYSAISQARIQEYNAQVASYAEKVRAYLGELSALRDSEIAEYQNKVNAFISEYSTKNQTLISEYSSKSQVLINEYTAEVNYEGTKFQADLSKAVSYLQESQTAISVAQTYESRAQSIVADYQLLKSEFEQELMAFSGVAPQQAQS